MVSIDRITQRLQRDLARNGEPVNKRELKAWMRAPGRNILVNNWTYESYDSKCQADLGCSLDQHLYNIIAKAFKNVDR